MPKKNTNTTRGATRKTGDAEFVDPFFFFLRLSEVFILHYGDHTSERPLEHCSGGGTLQTGTTTRVTQIRQTIDKEKINWGQYS